MTDYTTIAKLKMSGKCLDKLDGQVSQDIIIKGISKSKQNRHTNYIVITEDGETSEDFKNICLILNLDKKNLPTINKRYYRKEFIQNNWDIIFETYSSMCMENTEEELDYLLELEKMVIDEDWCLEELEDFHSAKTIYVNDHPVFFPHPKSFKGYENAFVYKPVPALVFEVICCTDIPSYYFSGFKNMTENKVTCLSHMFPINNILEHFDNEEKHSNVHKKDIELIKDEYFNDEDESEPYYMFAFG